ncbi:YraN family protein [Clostridium sp. DL1XJH146]
MKRYNKLLGSYGEKLTMNYLINHDYFIKKMNYTCFLGEIDIIASKDDLICFVEVRSRYGLKMGLPRESITNRKIRTIKKVAELYILQNNIKSCTFRFDFSEIIFKDTNNYKLNYLKNAF